MQKQWQDYRDHASQLSDAETLRHLYTVITLDTTAMALHMLGSTPEELLEELERSAEARKTSRDVLATAWYIVQGQKLHVAKAWLLGPHPGFGEESPIDLFRLGRGDEVVEHLRTDGRIFGFSLSA